MAEVHGNCPMGCGETLFLGEGGFVTCSAVNCPRPDAAARLLADRETEHIVRLRGTGFAITHPLRERLDAELEDCPLHAFLSDLDGPPRAPGRYRVLMIEGRWAFEPVVEPDRG